MRDGKQVQFLSQSLSNFCKEISELVKNLIIVNTEKRNLLSFWIRQTWKGILDAFKKYISSSKKYFHVFLVYLLM